MQEMKLIKHLDQILIGLEDIIIQFEIENGSKPGWSQNGFRAATKIFMSVMMDKIWELQEKENITLEDRCKMAEKCGQDLRKFILTYTDIDTFILY